MRPARNPGGPALHGKDVHTPADATLPSIATREAPAIVLMKHSARARSRRNMITKGNPQEIELLT